VAGIYLSLCADAQESTRLRFVSRLVSSALMIVLIVMTGIAHDASGDDPHLGSKRLELVTVAAQKLAEARMIMFDRTTGVLTITDLGRIAAKYYIRYRSIEIFNKEFRPKMSEADVLRMLCMSTEVCAFDDAADPTNASPV
jgi:replicative superfamily II helicase